MPISFDEFHKQQKQSKIRSKMLSKKGGKSFKGNDSGGKFEKKRPPAWKMRMRDNKFKPDEMETRIRILPRHQSRGP